MRSQGDGPRVGSQEGPWEGGGAKGGDLGASGEGQGWGRGEDLVASGKGPTKEGGDLGASGKDPKGGRGGEILGACAVPQTALSPYKPIRASRNSRGVQWSSWVSNPVFLGAPGFF